MISLLTYIRSIIFDAFYDNNFEVYENDEVILRNQKKLGNCTFVKLIIGPSIKSFDLSSGWILKLHNIDGSCIHFLIKGAHYVYDGQGLATYAGFILERKERSEYDH